MSEQVGTGSPVGEVWSRDRESVQDGDPQHPIGQWGMVIRRFRRHRLAMVSLWVLLAIVLIAAIGPAIAPPVVIPSQISFNPGLVQPRGPTLWPLSLSRIMGADVYGTPVTTYLLDGAWPTLVICVLGALIAETVGALIGGIAGYFGGVVDAALSRVLDAFFCVPFLPLLIVAVSFLPGRSWPYYCLLFGLTGWPGVARLVRGSVLSLREREYAEAARALGCSDGHVIVRHLIPNAIDILIVSVTLNVAVFILALANLTYLNAQPDTMLWANALVNSGDLLNVAWWLIVFPGAAILCTVLAVNFLGDGLRDAFDITSSASIDYRVRPHGRFDAVVRRVAMPMVAGARALRAGVSRPRRRVSIASPVDLPTLAAGRGVNEGLLALPGGPAGALLRIGLPVALLLGGIGAVLWSHSPLAYAPNFSSPRRVGVAGEISEYGAAANSRGVTIAFVDAHSRVEVAQTSATGAILSSRTVGASPSPQAAPSVAVSASETLAVWSVGNSLAAAWMQGSIERPFRLTTGAASLSNPDVVALPGGVFDVLYQHDTANGGSALSLIRVSAADGVSASRSLGSGSGLFPHAVRDGSGHLDVLWLSHAGPGRWHIDFARYTDRGAPIGRVAVLDSATYEQILNSGQVNPNLVPRQWALDLQPAADGGVWAAWTGDNGASVARWNRSGRQVLAPTPVVQGWAEAPTDIQTPRAIAIAPQAHGALLFHRLSGPYSTYLQEAQIGTDGQPLGAGPQRIDYVPGVSAQDPRAVVVGGHVLALWEQARYANAPIVAAQWHATSSAPDALTRLGLNLGSPIVNAVFVLAGALALGAAVAAADLGVVVLLLVLWWVLRRARIVLPMGAGALAPICGVATVYTGAIAVVLLFVFGVSDSPPPWVPVVTGLGMPGRAIAVLGGAVLAWWAGQTVFRRTDPAFRAAGMALVAVYFVAILWAATFVQGQITQV